METIAQSSITAHLNTRASGNYLMKEGTKNDGGIEV